MEYLNTMDYFDDVCKAFDLDGFERHCIRLAVLQEMDPADKGPLTVARCVEAWGEPVDAALVYRYFLPDGTLLRFFFFPLKGPAFIQSILRLKERMLQLLTGSRFLENPFYNGLMRLVWPEETKRARETDKGENNTGKQAHEDCVPESPEAKTLEAFLKNRPAHSSWLVGLSGPKGSGRRYEIKKWCSKAGLPLLIVNGSGLFSGDTAYSDTVREIVNDILRECIFFQAMLMISDAGELKGWGRIFKMLLSVLPVLFVSSEERLIFSQPEEGFSSFWIQMHPPERAMAVQIWKEAARGITVDPEMDFMEMADKYTLLPGKIFQIMELARADAGGEGKTSVSRKHIGRACRTVLSQGMGEKTVHVDPAFGWDDLVLPRYQKRMLKTACDQVRYKNRVYEAWGFAPGTSYGRGISMVFSGLPGTGKTMAASVMAKTLDMDLYKVELAAVVSKYIGETEKNLEEIFSQAADSQAILFFDEADVLFSKRTEVKSSNDKYSNMEAAYMLQKMEAYDGVVILSTNYLQNFDEAFKRRMKLIVDFPFPDEQNRLILWKQVFPDRVPLDTDVDFEYLARQFEFSGSNIKNSALYASFLAAAGNAPVTMAHVIAGVRNECAKIGKILRPEDMGEYYMLFKEDIGDV